MVIFIARAPTVVVENSAKRSRTWQVPFGTVNLYSVIWVR